ncbi:MAG: hypothetical protein WC836_05390 [Desulfobacula sp.]|jgi:hypothetical protein
MGKKQSKPKKIEWLPIVALVIALFGGIPGALGVIDYIKRSSIIIDFDKGNSIACQIKSSNSTINGRPAVLLYRVTITGKGVKPTYLREMKLSVKINGNWHNGQQFSPTQRDENDKNGVTKRAIHIRMEKLNDHDDLLIADWENFHPGEKGLSYGEPSHFSYGAYFDVNSNEFAKCDKLKIVVTDYLGNEYSETVDGSPFTGRYSKLSLLQD